MMEIQTQCPMCRSQFNVQSDRVGRQMACERCGVEFIVQGQAARREPETLPPPLPWQAGTSSPQPAAMAPAVAMPAPGMAMPVPAVAGASPASSRPRARVNFWAGWIPLFLIATGSMIWAVERNIAQQQAGDAPLQTPPRAQLLTTHSWRVANLKDNGAMSVPFMERTFIDDSLWTFYADEHLTSGLTLPGSTDYISHFGPAYESNPWSLGRHWLNIGGRRFNLEQISDTDLRLTEGPNFSFELTAVRRVTLPVMRMYQYEIWLDLIGTLLVGLALARWWPAKTGGMRYLSGFTCAAAVGLLLGFAWWVYPHVRPNDMMLPRVIPFFEFIRALLIGLAIGAAIVGPLRVWWVWGPRKVEPVDATM